MDQALPSTTGQWNEARFNAYANGVPQIPTPFPEARKCSALGLNFHDHHFINHQDKHAVYTLAWVCTYHVLVSVGIIHVWRKKVCVTPC